MSVLPEAPIVHGSISCNQFTCNSLLLDSVTLTTIETSLTGSGTSNPLTSAATKTAIDDAAASVTATASNIGTFVVSLKMADDYYYPSYQIPVVFPTPLISLISGFTGTFGFDSSTNKVTVPSDGSYVVNVGVSSVSGAVSYSLYKQLPGQSEVSVLTASTRITTSLYLPQDTEVWIRGENSTAINASLNITLVSLVS